MTKYINIFGGPGVGKSTTAAMLFAEMKKKGLNVELVTEVAKDFVWEGRMQTLDIQPYVTMKQFRNLYRLKGKVDYVITDAPMLFGDHLFIRPDSGFKSFTGFDVKIEDLDFELSSLTQLKNPGSYEMCLITKAKPILAEYRLIVCEGEIITGSQYRWDGKMDIRIDIHHDCWTFADENVAKADWQLDTCYTVDIFLSEDGPRIGEFNSFASSGLYNCDTDKIVEKVSAAALHEWGC